MGEKPKKIKRFSHLKKKPLPPMDMREIAEDIENAFNTIITDAESIASQRNEGFHAEENIIAENLDEVFSHFGDDEPSPFADDDEQISVSDTNVGIELRALFEDILLEYIPNIKSCMNKIFKGDSSRSTIKTFQGVLDPLVSAAEKLKMQDILRLLREFESHLRRIKDKQGSLSYNRYIRPFSETYERLILSLSPQIQQQYFNDTRFHVVHNPLFDRLQDIRLIGPKRLERIYAAGLMDIESLMSASAEEIHAVTGIGLRLARRVKKAARLHRRQMQREAVGRVTQAALTIKNELGHGLAEDQLRLLSETLGPIEDLQEWLAENMPQVMATLDRYRNERRRSIESPDSRSGIRLP